MRHFRPDRPSPASYVAVFMSSGEATSRLRGRRSECEALDSLLAAARTGRGGVLVLHGEAGIGKTALLDYLLEHASGCRVARAAGVESETELPFAGLHQLCMPFMDRLESLPGPQRDALGTALGLQAGVAPDRFLIGLAILGVLSDVAQKQPLVCLIDDAQWLDLASAQTLAFVARRLVAAPVAVVFAERVAGGEQGLGGLPVLRVHGVSDVEARELLGSAVRGRLDEAVRDRIVAETRGNPLALLALPSGLTPAAMAGGFGLPDTMPLATSVEHGVLRRLLPLSVPTRLLLLTAAAEPVGDVTLLWRAVERLGIGADVATAGAAGLVEFGANVRFRHPLVRSAVYRAASPADRKLVHHALAEVTDRDLDPDRRAWHRAKTTSGPDESIASELEHSAGRAQARGGIAAAAAFLERAAALTPDAASRAQRALQAAHAKHQAGAPDSARALLAMAQAGPLSELQRARADLLHARISFTASHGSVAPPLLLRAARQLEPLDVALAREAYLEALAAAQVAGRFADGNGLREIASAARAAPPAPKRPDAKDLLLDGLAIRYTDGYAASAPVLKSALAALRSQDLVPSEEELSWLWLGCITALDLWDDETWDVLAARHVRLVRDVGALTVLPVALSTRSAVHVYAGELGEAAALIEEAKAVTAAIGSQLAPYAALHLTAARGDEPEALELIEGAVSEVESRGQGIGLNLLQWARSLLYNGLGRYEEAQAAAEAASEYPEHLGALVELVEAASRTGHTDRASDALERLAPNTRASGTGWALGMEARSRALLSTGEVAERLYREAVARLARTRIRLELGRAHLLYGEWLRRENRRLDAREELRAAHAIFSAMGVEGFDERARHELRATGETARRRTGETKVQLTAQETQIAHLAVDGQTNPQIAAHLYISPRTVEWHLRKVFNKLDIGSRKELRAALSAFETASAPA